MSHTLLITGGAGFIGSHLADDALAHGDRVVILDNLSTGKRENVPAGATFYQRDISEPGLDELVADEKIDVVSHHAAQVNVRISIADPTADARTNILATLDLIAACKNIGVTHLTNGCYRLHPVEWNIGEAAGALAAHCIGKKLAPRQVREDAVLLGDFQRSLVAQGVALAWPEEVRYSKS